MLLRGVGVRFLSHPHQVIIDMKLRRSVLVPLFVAVSTQQQLPSCAQTCLNRSPTTCGSGDTLCRCSSPDFVSGVSCCIVVNCGPIDQEAAAARLSSQCLSVGVTVPSTASCTSTSRTSTSVSTVQSVTTPPTSSPSITASSSAAGPVSNISSSSSLTSSHSPTGISTTTSTPTLSTTSSSPPSGLSAGAIAGTAVGSLVGIAILILALVLFRTRRPAAQGKQGDSHPSSHAPEFGDNILESDLVQIPQHSVVAAAPLHQPAIAELPSPSAPPRTEVDGFSHPVMTPPASSVPTTAVSELPSDRGSPVEITFDSEALSLISPVSPNSDRRNRE
ncbi:hypothetical protein B0T18DRAFT_115275 [Schizothecium vesticola]|uniref:CFEM domain-containing protein n=1 Tax=Schizothecium vesticola TaxID=314040 RepID=A0AA40F255_9PEZI|nr:hypothetical protein B0T18DRAFT_115275 [Schizothecium vesticola]